MQKKINQFCSAAACAFLSALLFLAPAYSHKAQAAETAPDQNNADQKAQVEAIRKILAEHPDLVLNVLRDNSEMVLEIAQQGGTQRRIKMLYTQWEKDLATPRSFQIKGRPTLGNPDAPVTIVAYSDLTCTHCRQAETVLNQVLQNYPGKIFFVFKPFVFKERPLAREAALTLLAAFEQSQEKGWALYHLLFENQEKLLGEGEQYIDVATAQVGLDNKRLQQDKKSARLSRLLDEDFNEAKENGVEGTPNFFVNGRSIPGAFPEEVFVRAINQAMNDKR